MNQGIPLVVYPVKDIAKAKMFYTSLLGAEPYADQPYYVGYKTGSQEVGLDPNGDGATGALAYCQVSDIRASLASLVDAGARIVQDVKDVGWGKLIATVKDADGNVVGLMQTS